jgi:hypothetical protein
MGRLPAGFDEAGKKLGQATDALERAIKSVEEPAKEDPKTPEEYSRASNGPEAPKDPWHERLDDLRLLKEQTIDIRQQLELLKLEIPRDTAAR